MSPKAVRHYTPMMEASVKDSFKVFDKLDEDEEAWNVYQYMLKLASQTVFKFALGYDAHHFETPDSQLNELVILIAQSLSLNKKVTSRGDWYGKLGFMPGTAAYDLKNVTTRLWTILNQGQLTRKIQIGQGANRFQPLKKRPRVIPMKTCLYSLPH
jgi:hypothetical protein